MGAAAQDRASRVGRRKHGAASAGKRNDCVRKAFARRRLRIPRAVVTKSSEVRTSLLATRRLATTFFRIEVPAQRPEIKVLPVQLPMARLRTKSSPSKNRSRSARSRSFSSTAHAEPQSPWQGENDRRHVVLWHFTDLLILHNHVRLAGQTGNHLNLLSIPADDPNNMDTWAPRKSSRLLRSLLSRHRHGNTMAH